ncbi:SDR family NAD(P)-dependent oxidoreductase [Flavobacterium sp. xlx-214]|uniref:SDR family NAD(P)-dependent oxidoreductase n=1 Tax=unclassified Flavobacterium TaxID=196869 RepID=UPI0013D14493|nr:MULTISPECIES: SDR family NAD(P)-dependent oxidoreductase [unclassified Flavobacterium]MBA5791835.1 SDR family NAD(P)-dependent oxidoreductase [Flavobacterium sp. xlx-221]QMI83072.1 SDR family NAD(P)-dependent oxidoreductase [Flavobacterium sp. xlx-214]
MKTIVITGASSGIGYATAMALANGNRLILCGRRTERLQQLQNKLHNTETLLLTFDVANKEEVFSAFKSLPVNWQNIDVLINNAGNAHGLARFQDADLDDLDAMIDINVKGLIYVTRACLPFLQQSKNAHIINLSSIAGKQVYTNGTTYCASKWAVEALTKGMRLDFLPLGIKVTSIAPGAVETEFSLVRFKGDADTAEKVYQGYEPLQAEDIAENIAFVVNQPKHVQIADVTILPKAQADGITILKE